MIPRLTLPGGLEISRIVYGMWRLGDDADTSAAHVRAKIEACLAQGITTMDQADIYGDYASETIFGAALKADPGLRDQLEIVTKCDIRLISERGMGSWIKHYDTSAAHITASVEHSLHNMNIEHIDLLLLHRPDPLMDACETAQALDGLVASGKVGHIGVSNFRPWDWSLLAASLKAPLVTNQIEISLSATGAFVNGDLAFLQQHGIPPMAWSPLAGGALFDGSNTGLTAVLTRMAGEQGVETSAIAVAWLLKHPARIVPVMGTNTLARIAGFGQALEVEMTREAWFELYQAANGAEVP